MIGLRVTEIAPDDPLRQFRSFFEAFPQTPLSWILPSHPFLEGRNAGLSAVLTEIKARIAALKDTVIPAGYAGTPHPLLLQKEIARELEWSLKNPWGSGTADVFRLSPDILMPVQADFRRGAAVDLYRRAGFRLIGLEFRGRPEEYFFRGPSVADDLDTFFCLALPQTLDGIKTPRARMALPRHPSHLFVCALVNDPHAVTRIASLIKDLGKGNSLVFTTPDAVDLPAGEYEKASHVHFPPSESFPVLPRLRHKLVKAAGSRTAGAAKSEAVRNVLRALADGKNEEKDIPPTAGKPKSGKGITYTANMPGEILLPGPSFDTRFAGGKLCELRENRRSLLPSTDIESSITLAGTRHSFTFDRIFSFDEETARGLEASLYLSQSRERAYFGTLRYYTAGELPWLIITGSLVIHSTDTNTGMTGITPLGIPLVEFDPKEKSVIEALYYDGSLAQYELPAKEEAIVVSGTMFSCRLSAGKTLVFGYVPHQASRIDPLEVRITKQKNRFIASINPFGSSQARSARAMAGLCEIRSFYLGIRDCRPSKPPHFSNAILKSIPTDELFRI